MEKIACTGYRGATTLEPMNWDYSHLNICQFLELAYEGQKGLITCENNVGDERMEIDGEFNQISD